MILLQAAMGLGLLIMFILGLLVFIILPIITILIFIKKYQRFKSNDLELSIKQKIFLALQSLLISIGLIFIIGAFIIIILYLTIDLTIS